MKITVSQVAKILGKAPSWVRAGIIEGYLPIGVATRNGKQIKSVTEISGRYGRIQYYISSKLLKDFTGINL